MTRGSNSTYLIGFEFMAFCGCESSIRPKWNYTATLMYRFYSTIYLCKSINIAINDNLFANEFSASMTTCIIPRGQIPIFKQPFD